MKLRYYAKTDRLPLKRTDLNRPAQSLNNARAYPLGDRGVEAHTADKNVVEAGRSRKDRSRRNIQPRQKGKQCLSQQST